ncbi:MAG TPA: SRPBCC domain-containing protein, partial [Gemmatimonadales bacterium]|nr:SRPBCC domain-containing protein [Gemmatimonadales bacterium]
TSDHTDTYHGRFVDLVLDERVVEVLAFETFVPALQGEMMITFTLVDAEGGTELLATHENVPPGISPAENETGWSMSLARLQALVEQTRA